MSPFGMYHRAVRRIITYMGDTVTAHRTLAAALAAAGLAAGIAGCTSSTPATAAAKPPATSQAAPTSAAATVFDVKQIAGWMGLHRFPTGGDWLWVGPNGLHGELLILNSAQEVNTYAGDTYVVTNPAGTIGVKLLGGEANGNDVEALAALKQDLAGLPPK